MTEASECEIGSPFPKFFDFHLAAFLIDWSKQHSAVYDQRRIVQWTRVRFSFASPAPCEMNYVDHDGDREVDRRPPLFKVNIGPKP